MNRSLKNKLLVPMVALIIVGMAGLSVLSYFKAKNALVIAITNQVAQITESTSEIMAIWIKDRKLEVKNWSG